MDTPKDLRDQFHTAILEMGDFPDAEGIRNAKGLLLKFRETLIHDINKQSCFRAMQRLDKALTFKTDRKRKELVDEAWHKIYGMILPEKRFKKLDADR